MSGRQVIRRPYKMALSLYRRLPRFLRLFIIRRIAPAHTVGALCLVEHQGRLLMLNQRHRRGWTFPGGLLNRGEDADVAVVREVEEETGLRCSLGRELPSTSYTDSRGRPKIVRYWQMQAEEGEFEPTDEVDEIAWLGTDEAAERLTYAHDRRVLEAL